MAEIVDDVRESIEPAVHPFLVGRAGDWLSHSTRMPRWSLVPHLERRRPAVSPYSPADRQQFLHFGAQTIEAWDPTACCDRIHTLCDGLPPLNGLVLTNCTENGALRLWTRAGPLELRVWVMPIRPCELLRAFQDFGNLDIRH